MASAARISKRYSPNVRDVRYSLLYILGFWFYLTPVIYPLSLVPDKYQALAQVNPMTPIVELFRSGLFGVGQVDAWSLVSTIVLIVVVASLGTAAAVSVSGLIGFVGIIVPHAVRLLAGSSYRVRITSPTCGSEP